MAKRPQVQQQTRPEPDTRSARVRKKRETAAAYSSKILASRYAVAEYRMPKSRKKKCKIEIDESINLFD